MLLDFAGTLTRVPDDFDDRVPWHAYLTALQPRWPAGYGACSMTDGLRRLTAAEEASWQDCVARGRSWTLADVLSHAGIPDSAVARRAYFACFAVGTEVTPDARAVLRELARRDVPAVLVSNTLWPREWIIERLRAVGALDLLRDVVVSSDHPFCKPNPAIFRYAAERLEVDSPQDAW